MSIQTYEIVEEFDGLSTLSFDDMLLIIGIYVDDLAAHEEQMQAMDEAMFVQRIRKLHPSEKLNLRRKLNRLH